MKKLIALSFICAVMAIACSRKAVPSKDSTAKSTSDKKTASDKTTAESTPTFGTLTGAAATTTDPVKPEDGTGTSDVIQQGKTVFVSKCGSCHALKNPGDYTAEQWSGILKKCIPRAKLNDSEKDQLIAYLKANAK